MGTLVLKQVYPPAVLSLTCALLVYAHISYTTAKITHDFEKFSNKFTKFDGIIHYNKNTGLQIDVAFIAPSLLMHIIKMPGCQNSPGIVIFFHVDTGTFVFFRRLSQREGSGTFFSPCTLFGVEGENAGGFSKNCLFHCGFMYTEGWQITDLQLMQYARAGCSHGE